MKSHILALPLLSILTLAPLGCGKSGSANVDPSPVENSFAGAEDAVKAAAARAVNAVKSADYDLAMAELLKLAADPKLTDSQKKAVAQVLDQLKSAVSDSGKAASDDASKALGDAQKTLGK
jgi:N-acetylglucosamine kinase-like BadF-type ATPase